jgi:hypothetical protein
LTLVRYASSSPHIEGSHLRNVGNYETSHPRISESYSDVKNPVASGQVTPGAAQLMSEQANSDTSARDPYAGCRACRTRLERRHYVLHIAILSLSPPPPASKKVEK